jgi:hypothetical protein
MADIRPIPTSQRGELRRLLDVRSPHDAMAAYYSLQHPEDRTTLFGYYSPSGTLTGFLAEARTGFDLFRPLLIPFVAQEEALRALLSAALPPLRPAVLAIPFEQRGWIGDDFIHLPNSVTEIYRLDPAHFQRVLNVLVTEHASPDGWPRYEIRSQDDQVVASAGFNWIGEHFGEIYLEAQAQVRKKRFTRSLLAAICGRLMVDNKIALYRIASEEAALREEAIQVGFRPTGLRVLVTAINRMSEEE